jgi:hypothetical protein
MRTVLFLLKISFCGLLLHSGLANAAPTPPPPCPGGICDIDPPTPANRLAKIDVSVGFGARSYYEIPNYSYLTNSVSLLFSIADGGVFQYSDLMHGMNPAKYMNLILRGRDRAHAQTITVTNPDGRFWTTSCYSQPADSCTLPMESAWITIPQSGPYDLLQATRPGRYLVKVYYDLPTPTKTLSFRAP